MKKFLTILAGLLLVFALGVAAVACDDEPVTPPANENENKDENTGDTTVSVTGVSLDKAVVAVEVDGTLTLKATVAPDNATDKTVTWTSSDEDVATVSGGTVKAVAAGEATITAKAGDKTATCKVNVGTAVVSDAEELAAAVAAEDGAYIVLEEGTYTLSAQLRFVDKSDITLVGVGEVILTQDEAFETESSSKGYTSMITLAGCTNVTIENITVTGAKSNGTDYAHGVNIVDCKNVTLKNVTATKNGGVGVLVNDSVVTLKGVKTSDNGWGGVNVDVVGRNWTVPATVLTVDAECEFAEVAQIYCDDTTEKTALEGKLDLPDAYGEYTVEPVTIWSTAEIAAE